MTMAETFPKNLLLDSSEFVSGNNGSSSSRIEWTVTADGRVKHYSPQPTAAASIGVRYHYSYTTLPTFVNVGKQYVLHVESSDPKVIFQIYYSLSSGGTAVERYENGTHQNVTLRSDATGIAIRALVQAGFVGEAEFYATMYEVPDWTAPKTDWMRSDYFNKEDYNRISHNLQYLCEQVSQLKGEFRISSLRTMDYSSYFYASDMNAVEEALYDIDKKIYGHNLIPYDYFNDSGYVHRGITFTINPDRSITANGANTESVQTNNSLYRIIGASQNLYLPVGTYILTGSVGGSGTTHRLYVEITKPDGTVVTYSQYDSPSVITISQRSRIALYVLIRGGSTANNVNFKPMLVPTGVVTEGYEIPNNLPWADKGFDPLKVYAYNDNVPDADRFNYIESKMLELHKALTNAIDGRRKFTWNFGMGGEL